MPPSSTVPQKPATGCWTRAVWGAAGQTPYPFGPLVRLLLLTGARLREVAEANWGEVDLDAGTLTVPTSRMKMKVAHVIPLPAAARAITAGLPRFEGGSYLFSTHVGGRGKRGGGLRPISGFSKFKAKFDERLGDVAPFTLHDLRRTVRTELSSLQVPPHIAEMVLGHHQQGIARVYDRHRYDAEKRQALGVWEARLLAAVEPAPASVVVPLRA
jgi:integrase